LKSIQSYLIKEQQEINKEVVSDSKGFGGWTESKNKIVAASLENRIKQLYEEFKQHKKSPHAAESFDREAKLSLLRDVFSIEFGQQFASSE
jgi:hypothetical protein